MIYKVSTTLTIVAVTGTGFPTAATAIELGFSDWAVGESSTWDSEATPKSLIRSCNLKINKQIGNKLIIYVKQLTHNKNASIKTTFTQLDDDEDPLRTEVGVETFIFGIGPSA